MNPKLVKPDPNDPKVKEMLAQAQAAEQQQAIQRAMAQHATLIARKLDIELALSGFPPPAQAGILVSMLASKIAEHGLNAKIIESNLTQAVTRARRFQERQKADAQGLGIEGEKVPEVAPETLEVPAEGGAGSVDHEASSAAGVVQQVTGGEPAETSGPQLVVPA